MYPSELFLAALTPPMNKEPPSKPANRNRRKYTGPQSSSGHRYLHRPLSTNDLASAAVSPVTIQASSIGRRRWRETARCIPVPVSPRRPMQSLRFSTKRMALTHDHLDQNCTMAGGVTGNLTGDSSREWQIG